MRRASAKEESDAQDGVSVQRLRYSRRRKGPNLMYSSRDSDTNVHQDRQGMGRVDPYEEEFDYNDENLESCISEALENLNTAFNNDFVMVIKNCGDLSKKEDVDENLRSIDIMISGKEMIAEEGVYALLIESVQHRDVQYAFSDIIESLFGGGADYMLKNNEVARWKHPLCLMLCTGTLSNMKFTNVRETLMLLPS